jgi:Concanavalin A-like lectin/glucanases superfamily/FecR protein
MSEPSSHDSHHPFAEIETLLSAMVDGQLQPEQRDRLSDLLRGNTAAQTFYRDYLATHIALEFRYGSPATPPLFVEDSLDDSPLHDAEQSGGSRYPFSNAMILPSLQEIEAEAGEPIDHPISLPPPVFSNRYQQNADTPKPRRWSPKAWAIAASVAIIVTVAVAFLTIPPKPIVATVSAQVDAKWSADSLPKGELRSGQHLVLTDGYAELLFVSGAKVVVQAPAEFTLQSRTSLLLSSGKLAATVVGGGFIVKTPSAAVTDLGTQFGVSIAADRTTRVEVFKGSVQAALLNNAAPVQTTLVSGQAADVLTNQVHIDPTGAQPQRFVRTLDGLIVRGELVADLRPDLSPNTDAWSNHATGDKSVGDFTPADHDHLAIDPIDSPVGKTIPALHLSEGGTLALFSAKNIPAELTQDGTVSVEAWLKPSAPLGPFNAVATWGGGEGKIAAQRAFLYGTITPFVGNYADLENWGAYQPTPNQWHYVVWVYQKESKTMTVYVDGQPAKTGKIDLHTSLSRLTLGTGPDPVSTNNFASSPLNGYLGAFRVQTGILSTSDIQHNFERGMPTDNIANVTIN